MILNTGMARTTKELQIIMQKTNNARFKEIIIVVLKSGSVIENIRILNVGSIELAYAIARESFKREGLDFEKIRATWVSLN